MIFSNVLNKHTLKSFLFPLGSSFLLWGCAEQVTYDFPPACPQISVLPSASDYYIFTNNQQDLSHLVTRASILGIDGNCIDDPINAKNKEKKKNKEPYQNKIDTNVNIAIQIQRGPTGHKSTYRIPYFIATTHDGTIVDKKYLSANVTFPDNIDVATIKSENILLKIPATDARTPDGYQLYIGFQLTPEQLQYNRDHFKAVKYTHF